MATTGSVYVDWWHRNDMGQIMVAGRVLVGANATIDGRDFRMRTIKSLQLDPWIPETAQSRSFVPGSIASLGGKSYKRRFVTMSGSIGSVDTLTSYVRIRTYVLQNVGTPGNRFSGSNQGFYIGTQAGSIRATYTAFGL